MVSVTNVNVFFCFFVVLCIDKTGCMLPLFPFSLRFSIYLQIVNVNARLKISPLHTHAQYAETAASWKHRVHCAA